MGWFYKNNMYRVNSPLKHCICLNMYQSYVSFNEIMLINVHVHGDLKMGDRYAFVTHLSQQIKDFVMEQLCHNFSFGFATKARACKGAGQEGSSGVTFHVPRSARECEGMNPHTSK